MIVRWPGVTRPGAICRQYVMIEDIFPTFLEMAGAKGPETTIDGVSWVPLLKGESTYPKERPVFWHYPNTYDQPPYSVVRQGDWKLIYHHVTRKLELFDVVHDISETEDRASDQPEILQKLAKILSDYLREVRAPMPTDKATEAPVPYPDAVSREPATSG
jgi:arylsulfatase A-like enzyme